MYTQVAERETLHDTYEKLKLQEDKSFYARREELRVYHAMLEYKRASLK